MPRPITLVDSGGMPITEATWGEPMTPVDAPLYGEPMTLVGSGGIPVVLVNDDLSPYGYAFISYQGQFVTYDSQLVITDGKDLFVEA